MPLTDKANGYRSRGDSVNRDSTPDGFNVSATRNPRGRDYDDGNITMDDAMSSIFAQRADQHPAFQSTDDTDFDRMMSAPPKVESKKELWKSYQAGDNTVTAPLLEELKPTIEKGVNFYGGNDKNLTTQAKLLALSAVKSYDPTKNAALSSHVYNHLQRLQRIAAQRGSVVKVPENAALEKRKLTLAASELELELGREPSIAELADSTGLSMKRIEKLNKMSGYTTESIASNAQGDLLAADKSKDPLELYRRYMYDELDPVDQKIYEWSTGFGGAQVLSRGQMAQKLGISQAAVSMRATKISQKFSQDAKLIGELIGAGN